MSKEKHEADKRAKEVHARAMEEDAEYRKAWEDMLAAVERGLNDSGLRRVP